MDQDDFASMDSRFEFAIREVSGGWLVKYLRGWTDDEDRLNLFAEILFTDEDVLTEWLNIRLRAFKNYRNSIQVEGEGIESYIQTEKP